jgi:hypothetical protein
MILVATIFLGGCLSSAEKAEGKRNVNEAKPYLKEYVKDKYGKNANSEYMWFNSDQVVEFDGSSVSIPEESYIGTYASSAYLLWEYQEELLVYSIDEDSIQQN